MRYLLTFIAVISIVAGACARRPTEFKMPDIPSDLRQPQQRADYLIIHFWDNMDFSDNDLLADTPFIEQNFANYLSVFPIAQPDTINKAVDILMEKASVNPEAYKKMFRLAETYLYEPLSPLYEEEYFIPFLQNAVQSGHFDETAKERPKYLLAEVLKNRKGSKATDFDFTLLDGSRTSLQETASGDSDVLLIFFDPDCSHCKNVIDTIILQPSAVQQWTAQPVKIIAVYSGDEEDSWKQYAGTLPSDWTVGIEPCEIYEQNLYALNLFPVIYLLGSDLTVKGKNLQLQ